MGLLKKISKEIGRATEGGSMKHGLIGQMPMQAQFGLLSEHLSSEQKQHAQHMHHSHKRK